MGLEGWFVRAGNIRFASNKALGGRHEFFVSS